MTTLAAGSQLGRGSVSNARKELIAAKLIVVVKGKGGLHETDRIRILDIWHQNMAEFYGIASSSGEHEPSSLGELGQDEEYKATTPSQEIRVQDMNAPSSGHERASSGHERASSPDELKKISLKKIPEKKEEPPIVPLQGDMSGRPLKEKRSKRYMPKEETAQKAMLRDFVNEAFRVWHVANHPEADIQTQWDWFVRYCLSGGKQYVDFRAAFMNSFAWDNTPAQPRKGGQLTNGTRFNTNWDWIEKEATTDDQR
jgi:hypothetical protein